MLKELLKLLICQMKLNKLQSVNSFRCPLERSTRKTDRIFQDLELFLDIGAIIHLLKTQNFNEIKMMTSSSECELLKFRKIFLDWPKNLGLMTINSKLMKNFCYSIIILPLVQWCLMRAPD